MELNNKTVVITGAGQGIGAAMAVRFAKEGAKVVVADYNADAAQTIAESISGLAVACDVTSEEDIKATVVAAEKKFGPIDLFCSNAGMFVDEPTHVASASNEVWQKSWDIHVMSHVYAARAVLPDMISRGSGYLLQMSSAAGLLSQIGNAAYSTTKHAAVGFAETIAITHADEGIKVSVICPQYVATPLLGYTAVDADSLPEGTITAETVAEVVLEGVRQESFLILPHPEVAKYIQFKSADYDKWLGSMRKLRYKIVEQLGTTDVKGIHKLV